MEMNDCFAFYRAAARVKCARYKETRTACYEDANVSGFLRVDQAVVTTHIVKINK